MVELRVRSTKEEMRIVTGRMEGDLEEKKCPPRELMEFSIALEELLVNIVNYAYQGGQGMIEIRYEITEASENKQKISVYLEDEGVPYNPLEKKDPDITLNVRQRKTGGLGIFMAKTLLNKLSYEYTDGKNKMYFEKEYRTI